MISTWLLEHIGLPALKYGALILAILGLIFGARKWGRNVEKVEQFKSDLAGAKYRANIDANSNDADDLFLLTPAQRKLRNIPAALSNH